MYLPFAMTRSCPQTNLTSITTDCVRNSSDQHATLTQSLQFYCKLSLKSALILREGPQMLIRFSASNFRSIDDRQELSMVASAFYQDHKEILIPNEAIPAEKLLPAAVIYGPNASGKSNLLAAFEYLQSQVLNSQSYGKPDGGVGRPSFALNSEGRDRPTQIEIEFISANTRYQYGFEANDEEFLSEWLFWYPHHQRQLLFERSKNKAMRFGRSLKGQNRVISELMRPNSLFLSAAAQNSHEQLTRVQSYFTSLSFQRATSDPHASSLLLSKAEYDPRIIDFIKNVGTGVVGFRTKKLSWHQDAKKLQRELWSVISRNLPPGDKSLPPFEEEDFELELAHGSNDAPVYFGVAQESSGTRRLLILLRSVFSALDAGSVVFIDELDASLHTQICETLLALFADRKINKRGAQLVATTHDTNLMRSRHLRRDQLWFTEKDQGGATHLYPLSDIRTRKTDDIERNYLQGRYGAIPFPGDMVDLFDD
jgi:predicted ATPase